MRNFCKSALASVHFLSGMLVPFALLFAMPGSGGYSLAVMWPQAIAAGCGSVDSSFRGPCILISFRGEVSANQAYERRIGGNLLFRLAPKGEHFGWDIQVVPERGEDANRTEYVWVVTPPYRFWNPRYLDVSYGMTPSEAVHSSPRDFNFVLNEEQYKKAADLVELAIFSRPQSDRRSAEEIMKESQQAMEALFKLSVAKGRLIILNSSIGTSEEGEKQGFIKWLEFRVDLRVPCSFSASDGSAGILIDKSKCSAKGSQKSE